MAVCIANKEIGFTKPRAVKLPNLTMGRSTVKKTFKVQDVENDVSQDKLMIELRRNLKRVGINSAVVSVVKDLENSKEWMSQFKDAQLHEGCYVSQAYYRGLWFNIYANKRNR